MNKHYARYSCLCNPSPQNELDKGYMCQFLFIFALTSCGWGYPATVASHSCSSVLCSSWTHVLVCFGDGDVVDRILIDKPMFLPCCFTLQICWWLLHKWARRNYDAAHRLLTLLSPPSPFSLLPPTSLSLSLVHSLCLCLSVCLAACLFLSVCLYIYLSLSLFLSPPPPPPSRSPSISLCREIC